MPTVSPPSSTACALFSPLVLCHCPTAQEDPALAHALAVNGLVRDTSPAASDSVNAVTGTTNAATGIAAAFARLLAPFESSPSAGQPLRRADSTLGQTYELQQAGFRVRFRGSVPVSQVDIPNAQLLLRDMSVATTSSPTTSTLDDTPHFDAFTARALSAIGVGEHETFHHPVAMIYTVSSSPLSTTGSADPLALLQRLVDRSVVVPPEMEQYMMGMGEILRFYVVVHDRLKSSGADGDARASELLDAVRKRFGLHCFLLSINSLDDAHAHTAVNGITDLYAQCLSSSVEISPSLPQSSPHYACHLSTDDVKNIRRLVAEFTVQSLVPHMDRQVQLWNEQVASSRRGITGRLFQASKRYFGSTGGKQASSVRQIVVSSGAAGGSGAVNGSVSVTPTSSSATSSRTITVYPAGSPEALMRKLADFAFLLQDYTFAVAIYDSVKKDVQSDRAYKYYAAVQEMIGLCHLLSNDGRDVDHFFESAVQTYSDLRETPQLLRTVLLYFEVLKQGGMYKECIKVLTRGMVDSDPLRSALFYEQIALCYNKLPIPSTRKHAFALSQAASRYQSLNQPTHARRCFTVALAIYSAKRWTLIDDHIHAHIASMAGRSGDLAVALAHAQLLLCESRQSGVVQQQYLGMFIAVYRALLQQHQQKGEVPPVLEGLAVPRLAGSGNARPQLTIMSAAAIHQQQQDEERMSFPEDVWTAMEVELSKQKRVPHGALRPASGQSIFAVKEPVTVIVELHNPLHVPLTLDCLRLECAFIAGDVPLPVDATAAPMTGETPTSIHFQGFSQGKLASLTLPANQTVHVSLALIPEAVGTMRLLSLRFLLGGIIDARLSLVRPSQSGAKENRTLDLVITPPMPRLDITFQLETTLLCGEVRRGTLLLRNDGEVSMHKLVVKMSHCSFFTFGSAVVDGGGACASTAVPSSKDISNRIIEPSVVDVPIPGGTLAPGATTSVPMWIRGSQPGKHHMRFLFAYKAAEVFGARTVGATGGSRLLRASLTLHVEPSVRVEATLRASTRSLNQFVVAVETRNEHAGSMFRIKGLAALSPRWKMEAMSGGASQTDVAPLPPGQTRLAYFRLCKEGIAVDALVTPEAYTSDALERLVVGERTDKLKMPSVELMITQVPSSLPIPLEALDFALTNHTKHRVNYLQNVFAAVPKSRLSELFTLYTSNALDLIVLWEEQMTTATPPRAGYHFISGLQLAAQQAPLQLSRDKSKQLGRALFAQTEREKAAVLNCLLRNRHLREENPVRVVTKVSDSTGAMSTTPASTVLHHDFRSRPSLTVVLTLRLLNTSWNRAVQCQLELLDTNKSDPTSSAATTAFHWIGMTSTHITLAPGEEKTISTHALIMRTGTHDLNRWRVVVNMTGDGQAVGDASCESTFVHVPGSPCYVEVRAPQSLHSVIGVSEITVETPPQKSVITVETPPQKSVITVE